MRIHANPDPQHCFQKEKKIQKCEEIQDFCPKYCTSIFGTKTLIKLNVFPVDFYGMVLAEKPTDLLPHLGQVLIMASVIMFSSFVLAAVSLSFSTSLIKGTVARRCRCCCRSGMFIRDPSFFHPGYEFFPSRLPIRIKELIIF